MVGWQVNDELARVRKETVYYAAHVWKENTRNFSISFVRNLNPEVTEYESKSVTSTPTRLMGRDGGGAGLCCSVEKGKVVPVLN
jgi:hypothetical protein